MIDKQKLREHLLNLEDDSIKNSEVQYQNFLDGNRLKYDEVRAPDDQARHKTNLDLTLKLGDLVHEHQQHRKILEDLSFEPTQVVKPGAIVTVNGRCLVIALYKSPFEFEGREFMGISTSAPLYQCLKGKEEGDSFTFNNKEYSIDAVI